MARSGRYDDIKYQKQEISSDLEVDLEHFSQGPVSLPGFSL